LSASVASVAENPRSIIFNTSADVVSVDVGLCGGCAASLTGATIKVSASASTSPEAALAAAAGVVEGAGGAVELEDAAAEAGGCMEPII